MAVEQEIEHDEIDATAEKAKAIGAELGVEKDEEIPDYDIQEESDERLGKERETKQAGEKKERPQLSNRQKREMRKKRLNEKFNEKDAIIAAQQEQINQLARWKDEVDGRLSGINKAEIDKALNDASVAFQQAENDHATAFAEGDGTKATKAMRLLYEAQKRIDQLQGIKSQLDKQPTQTQSTPQNNVAVVNKAKSWAERNTWYDASGKDVDSEIAKAISGVLANEGYDPKTDDFWDELDDRLREKLPEKLQADEDEYEDEADEVVAKPRKRTGPPVGGGTNRGDVKGKISISLPTAYIKTLKDNGLWDDVQKRNRLIQRYLAGVKENRA